MQDYKCLCTVVMICATLVNNFYNFLLHFEKKYAKLELTLSVVTLMSDACTYQANLVTISQ